MFARTERLLLRPGWQEDAPALARAIGDEMIVRNLSRAPWPYDEAHARAFLGGWTEGNPSRFLMIQRTASAPRLIGCIGMDRMESGDVELGYWVARPYWGLGYATEAGRHMIDLARTLGIRRLVASHFTDNPASGAVLRKLGFRPTGRHPERASLGRSQTAPTIEYAREIAAPGNDGDGEDSPVAMPGLRWPDTLREDWRLAAA
ncbi:GNAT family N-acetyltransferase [Sphingopyxis indica]|uniref:Protein N-acetyltransferase, RimJ/RimL family n=1 Tax=Sphingopyxis indica TaxID=436663 RepID=A0A239KGW8_9SPHN|nr:GNAT family N-acetyltransferase [Sphingopyxis indica]WOF43978.1 GNAT family N-acetyltransferase [Sphingopyxis indica]SNT16938.1 Protein N-acetyltransferase, RimJ/RimL family [Sphingopyxis indica]